MVCHRGSGRQVLSCSDALISQPFCCRCQVSEMMLTLMGGPTCVGGSDASTAANAINATLYAYFCPRKINKS